MVFLPPLYQLGFDSMSMRLMPLQQLSIPAAEIPRLSIAIPENLLMKVHKPTKTTHQSHMVTQD
jgi:hypothetical protein